MDSGEVLARLEKIDSDPIGAGLARNWHRNPDGPEAAALIRQLLREADDHAERASHWRDMAGQYHARIEALEAEAEQLRLAGLSMAQAHGGCEEVVCTDPQDPNCHCTLRFALWYRTAGEIIRDRVRGARARALLGERGE